MRYAIFTRRGKDGFRRMHAVNVGGSQTVCGLPIGIGSGLVRDGDNRNNRPCGCCWETKTETTTYLTITGVM